MNSSPFMDKQIMALSGSQGGGGDFFDLMNPQEERHQSSSNGGGIARDEILASYDFQPIRGAGSPSHPAVTGLDSGARNFRGSDESHTGLSSLKFTGIPESHEMTKVSHEKESDAYDVAKMAEIDHTVKKHADNLLLALEGVSSRLSQLESRTHHLETSVDELKVSIGDANGCTDGKLRQLENILREVQTGVQVLRDKQEITETQLQLAKLQASEEHSPPKQSHTAKLDSQQQQQQQATPPPVQLISQVPIAPPQPPQLPSLPAPNPPLPAPPQQNSSVQFPAQFPQSQAPSVSSLSHEPYFPQPTQSTDTSHQQSQTPAQQPQQLPQALHYQLLPQMPQFSQPIQPSHPVNPSLQFQPTLPHHPEEAPYMPPTQTYTPNIRQAVPPTQPASVLPPPQQYYGPNPSMYEPPSNRAVSGQGSFSPSYGPPSGPSLSDPYPNSGSPSRYRNSIKPSPFSSSASPSSGSNYPRLPTAQILPQALPTGSSSGSTNGNRVPIDDVVDKVSTMGFSREQVRATVRKLTENGQSVDLNVVLDKLMNDGEIQPQKGWFGR